MPRIPDSMIPRLRERMMKMKQAPEPDPVETERKLMNFAGAAVRNLLRKGTSRKMIPLERCRAALLMPKTLSCEGVIIYLHGGGYCTGDLDYACLYGEVLASETGAVTFCPAYRLAPEDPFPAALDDALEAYEWILNEYPGKPVSLIGESAGGGLCYTLSLKLKEKGLTLVPLRVYFKNSLVKVEIGLARGKKLYDKRQDIAKKDQKREAERDFKVRNIL